MDWQLLCVGLIYLLVFDVLVCGPLGAFLAQTKGRSGKDGAIAGAVLGPFGLVLIGRCSARPNPNGENRPVEVAKTWLAVALVALVAIVVLTVLAEGLAHTCPAGQHPEGVGGDLTCEYDR